MIRISASIKPYVGVQVKASTSGYLAVEQSGSLPFFLSDKCKSDHSLQVTCVCASCPAHTRSPWFSAHATSLLTDLQIDVITGVENAQVLANYIFDLKFSSSLKWYGEWGPWELQLEGKDPGVVIDQTSLAAWCACLPGVGCGSNPSKRRLLAR